METWVPSGMSELRKLLILLREIDNNWTYLAALLHQFHYFRKALVQVGHGEVVFWLVLFGRRPEMGMRI